MAVPCSCWCCSDSVAHRGVVQTPRERRKPFSEMPWLSEFWCRCVYRYRQVAETVASPLCHIVVPHDETDLSAPTLNASFLRSLGFAPGAGSSSWTRSSTSACRRGLGPPEAARPRAPAPHHTPPAAGGTALGRVPPRPRPAATATATGDVTTEILQGAIPPPVPGRVPCPLTGGLKPDRARD